MDDMIQKFNKNIQDFMAMGSILLRIATFEDHFSVSDDQKERINKIAEKYSLKYTICLASFVEILSVMNETDERREIER